MAVQYALTPPLVQPVRLLVDFSKMELRAVNVLLVVMNVHPQKFVQNVMQRLSLIHI